MKIIVYSYVPGFGYGDIFIGSKIVSFLKSRYPQAKIHFIADNLHLEDPIKQQECIAKFNSNRADMDKIIMLDAYAAQPGIIAETVDLFIVCPLPKNQYDQRYSRDMLDRMVSIFPENSRSNPLVLIPEYDFEEKPLALRPVKITYEDYLRSVGCTNVHRFNKVDPKVNTTK